MVDYLIVRDKILGHTWTVYFCSPKFMKRKYPESDRLLHATTEIDSREIFVNSKLLTEETLRHELAHAYIAELCVATAGIQGEELEEVYCEMVAKYGERIALQASRLATKYRMLRTKASS